MAITVISWVLWNSLSTGNDRLVLIALADEANDDGWDCYPSMDRLARKARISKATAIRATARLEHGGELLVKRPEVTGRGKFNRYALCLGRNPLHLADHLGWPPPALQGAPEDWLQSDTLPDEGAPVDNSALVPRKGSERLHDGPEKVRPGATRPVVTDPYTRGRLRGERANDPMETTQAAHQAMYDKYAKPPCETCAGTGWIDVEAAGGLRVEECRKCAA